MSIRLAILCCTILPVLSACSDQREFVREKYTGERYGEPVKGPRRAPVLNPAVSKMATGAKQGETPTPNPPEKLIVPAPVGGAAATPYDKYDNKGNDVTRTNYLRKWVDPKGKEQNAAPAEKPVVEKPVEAPVRKPIEPARKQFKGVNTPDAEPLEVMPQRKLLPVVEPVMPAKPERTEPETISIPAGMEPQEDNGVFLPDIEEKHGIEEKPEPKKRWNPEKRSENSTARQFAQLQPAVGRDYKGYPRLSSVPKVPPEFTAVRQEKAALLQELQAGHDAAQEQKRLLGQEPTELTPPSVPQVDGLLREIDGAIHVSTPIPSRNPVIEQNDMAIKKLESITRKRTPGVTVASLPRIDRILNEASSAASE